MKTIKSENVTANITAIGFGGSGIGEIEQGELRGLKIFIPYTAVGDHIECEIVNKEKNYAEGRLINIISASLDRIDPPCEYFRKCGGCELQHINYSAQIKIKRDLILKTFERHRFPNELLDCVREIVPSEPYNYRMRASFHISSNGKIGFFTKNTRELIEIKKCMIVDPAINHYLSSLELYDLSKFLNLQIYQVNTEIFSILELREENKFEDLTTKNLPPSALITQLGKNLNPMQDFELKGIFDLKIKIPVGGFTQVNPKINQKLVTQALNYSKSNYKSMCDLFAGAGNFALPFAHFGLKQGLKVTAIEGAKNLVNYGIQNAKNNNLSINYIHSSVEKYLKSNKSSVNSKVDTFDLVLTDPPRSGLKGLIKDLPKSKRLIHISCDFGSFTRDALDLYQAGYHPVTILPFDMFPQTTYLEILSVFDR